MDNTSLIDELQKSVNAIYWVMNQLSCDKQLEDELYPIVYSLERVISELENESV